MGSSGFGWVDFFWFVWAGSPCLARCCGVHLLRYGGSGMEDKGHVHWFCVQVDLRATVVVALHVPIPAINLCSFSIHFHVICTAPWFGLRGLVVPPRSFLLSVLLLLSLLFPSLRHYIEPCFTFFWSFPGCVVVPLSFGRALLCP